MNNQRRLRSPYSILAMTAVGYLSLIVLALAWHGNDPSFFIVAGDQFAAPASVPKNLTVLKNSPGYDGQFYYRMALNPFTTTRTEFGITLDYPAVRQARIVYPLIVWMLSLGKVEVVPFMLILVNYIALCAVGWLGGLYAQTLNRNTIWGLVFSLYPGFVLTLLRDLTEILAIAFLLASLLFVRFRRDLLAALFMSLALLTRETVLLVPTSILIAAFLMERRSEGRDHQRWYFYVIPIFVWLLWQLFLMPVWGQIPLLANPSSLSLPFLDFLNFLQWAVARVTYPQKVSFVELCFVILFVIAVLYVLRSSVALPHEKLSWLLYAALAFSLNNLVWVEDWSFLRALSEFYLFGAIILLGSQSRIKVPIFAYSLMLWLLLFIRGIA